jgi:hypothetical protein
MTDRLTGDAEESSRSTGRGALESQNARVSPWPPLVAAGFAVAEIGIALNLVALAIGGLVLFGGSVAGILRETAYVDSAWATAAVLGGVFIVLGTVVWTSQVATLTVETLLDVAATDAVAMRGEAIVVGGALLVVGAIGGAVVRPETNGGQQ